MPADHHDKHLAVYNFVFFVLKHYIYLIIANLQFLWLQK